MNRQDFALIKTLVEKKKVVYSLKDSPSGFYFAAMELLFSLQEDEIVDSITDTKFLKLSGKASGRDGGIDAIYIDHSTSIPEVNILNFKHTEKFEIAKENNFPGGEIDAVVNSINSIYDQDEDFLKPLNPLLKGKIREIWDLWDVEGELKFKLHFCSNFKNGFEKSEKARLEDSTIKKYRNFEIKYQLISDFIERIFSKEKVRIDAKIKAIDKKYFNKSDGEISALIAYFDARDLIRIVVDNEDVRSNADMDKEEYEDLKNLSISEDAFEENVRLNLKNSSINKSIKATALSDENKNFFYYNNGITITCELFSYAEKRSPIVTLENIQVVNGAQTLYSLHEAFQEDSTKVEDIEILCRICGKCHRG
ncbi:MAG: AIPR family protein [Cyanobacteria bacterium]|nr:AIPR family protein [Cyanobacteriota bacterium]